MKPGKLDELNCIIQYNIPSPVHVIILSETWIKSESEAKTLNLPNYTHYYNIRENTRGGGVSIFVHDCLKHNYIEDFCIEDNHYLWVHLDKYSLDIGAVYKTPKSSNNRFLEEFSQQLIRRKRALVFGDFNYDLLSLNRSINNYTRTLTENGHLILNKIDEKFSTRDSSTKKSILDHVSSNLKNHKFHLTIVESPMSDHKQIYLEVGKYTPEMKNKIKYNTLDYTALYHTVESIITNISESDYGSLEDTIKGAVNKNIISKFKIQNTLKSDWINKDIIGMLIKRNELWSAYKENPNDDLIRNNFITLRNAVTEQIQNTKNSYYYKAFKNCERKPLKMWKLIGNLAGSKSKSCPAPSKLETQIGQITDTKEICIYFNTFFATIGSILASKITKHKEHIHTQPRTQTSISSSSDLLALTLATEEEVSKIIDKLNPNTSSGLDGISCKTIKCIKNLILPKLTMNINFCMQNGLFPDSLKVAKVSPIYKSGKKTDPGNYRPISVLPIISKIFEKILYKRLDDYLKAKNFLSKKQYGFRAKSNTLTATIDLVTNLKNNIDEKCVALGIFIDLKKAFDTISHSLLLQKLYDVGIRNSAHDMFRSYLSNRQQIVRIGDELSNCETLTYGVPQGSILGPLLFIIYVNDIHNLNLTGDTILYADDTSLFLFGNSIEGIIEQAQQDLDTLSGWFQDNLLTVNSSKTNYIIFSARNKKIESHSNLYINNEPLTQVSSEKYLGLHLDKHLTWQPHLDKLRSKLSSIMGALRGIVRCLPTSVRYIIYNSMVKPHLEYLIEVWGTAAKTHLKQIETCQNKIIKRLFHYHYLTPTEKIYKETKLMTLSQIYKYNTCILVHKLIHKNIHSKITFTKKGQTQKRITRRMNNICLRPPRTNYGRKNILYEGAELYNKLPNDIKEIQSFTLYKKTIKHHILKDFSRF